MRGSCFVSITRKHKDYIDISQKLRETIAQPWAVGNAEVMLQATICCISTSELPSAPVSPEETVNCLETVFLQSEVSGSRVKTVTLGPELLDKINRRRAVEAALREALKTGEGLELYFQPLWSVKRERFDSAEVLLRFNHREMGFIPPDEFVPIAESCGLITALDELVVRKACAFLHENNQMRELSLETLEINLSALEFMHRRLPEMIDGIIKQYNVDARLLCFEITETAATKSFDLLNECMLEMCEKGCRFALDDFGTGYANISQVIRLPFSIVKLDRSLLFGSEVVLCDMTHMFSRMNRTTVIEGVETETQDALVRSFYVDYIQGYYYSKPMNAADFIAFFKKHAENRIL